MGVAFASERRLLSEAEFEPVLNSHHPVIAELERDQLIDLARLLRDHRNRARDLLKGQRRSARGKGEGRGGASEPANAHGLAAKKQVFARGLKRVNARLADLRAEANRAEAHARLLEALERKHAAVDHRPAGARTAREGMRAKASDKRRQILMRSKIGRVSQATRNAQAAHDARNA